MKQFKIWLVVRMWRVMPIRWRLWAVVNDRERKEGDNE